MTRNIGAQPRRGPAALTGGSRPTAAREPAAPAHLAGIRVALLAGPLLFACVPDGTGPIAEAVFDESGVAEEEKSFPSCAVQPISEEEAAQHRSFAVHAASSPPLVVFLNRAGGTYSPGANDSSTNRSSIVSRTYSLPAFSRGEARWNALVSCVREQYARFNVSITEVEPAAGSYIEAVISGHPSQIGLSSGIGGIAPIDTYGCRPIERAIAYVFETNLGTDRNLCEVTAHEIGHTLSLEHEYKCEDPMTYLYGCGDKTFQDLTASCGTYAPERCACRGGTQNTVQALLDLVGPSTGGGTGPDPATDLGPPVVELLSPADGSTFAANTAIEIQVRAVDDQHLARTELIWDFNGQVYTCPMTSQYVDCTTTGDLYTWIVRAGEGQRRFHARALDLAGNEALTPVHTIQLTATGAPPPVDPDASAPEVVVVSPADGAVVPPNSAVEISAEVTDDVSVGAVELVWEFNNSTYPCPTSQSYVTCAVSGSRYTWTLRLGVAAQRPFSVRATDGSGKVTSSDRRIVDVRTISDSAAPAITLMEPSGATVFPANSELKVVAEITDDVGVSAAELVWDFNRTSYPCPYASTYVDCAIESHRYTWLIRAGSGARSYRVTASDTSGNRSTSADGSITLQ